MSPWEEIAKAKVEIAEQQMRIEMNRQLYADMELPPAKPTRISFAARLHRMRSAIALWIAPWLGEDDW